MGGDLADVRLWAGELSAVHERFVHRFNREEPRQSALADMRGLIAPLERKNGWTLAEEAGHTGPDRIHRLLNRIEWDADEALDDVRDYVVEHLGDRDAGLIVDDTGFLKKGIRSAGVQRQYSGTAGRTENSQIGVFLAYATNRGRTLIDRRLYLPTSWTDDRCTDRTLTRNCLATVTLSCPRANSSAARIRMRSRNARRSGVSPPPCGYLVQPAYRSNHRLSATTSHQQSQ
ncbi:hypothetical protein GCM10010390_73250 [Streptomyces mordarskii]|uniref:Transposase IS701-like DDE domain-containing protein n=1 Tax=Streptomyces mordarskii TaxID=1226758 RepID=A0ABN1E6V2_9ACTN